MRVHLFTFVDLYDRALATASHLLGKATDFAKEHGVPEKELLLDRPEPIWRRSGLSGLKAETIFH